MEVITNKKFELKFEIRDVPVSFVNAIRRIILSEIPTVVISNVEILDNNTSMTHEMIRHRIEQLPINAQVSETDVIKNSKIEVRFDRSPEPREILTDDFVVLGPRKNILLYDIDLDQPILFMNLAPNESLHFKATLGIATTSQAQQSITSYKNHIDPERAQRDRDTWTIGEKNDAKIFDNSKIQRSYHVNEAGRPDWFDFFIESFGITPSVELLKSSIEILKKKILDFTNTTILREKEPGQYRLEIENETFTLGCLVQEKMYLDGLVDYVSYHITHPLQPKLIIRFNTKIEPEKVINRFKEEALALCENVLKGV